MRTGTFRTFNLFLLAFLLIGFQTKAQLFTETTTYGDLSSLNIGRSAVAPGDYDGDGDMDLLVIGEAGASKASVTKIYKNNGASGFADVTVAVCPQIDSVMQGTANWLDYDNDGRLDFLITGSETGTSAASDMSSLLYHQKTDGTFELIATPVNQANVGRGDTALVGVTNSTVSIADYNQDGWVDILISGAPDKYDAASGSNNRVIRLYRNTHSSTTPFENSLVDFGNGKSGAGFLASGPYLLPNGNVNTSIAGVAALKGVVSQVDVDHNGTLDLFTFGYANMVSRAINDGFGVYSNQINSSDVSTSVAGFYSSICASNAWGDFDGDGDVDAVMAWTNTAKVPVAYFDIFQNGNSTLGSFTKVSPSPFDTVYTSGNTSNFKYREQWVTCGDYDNDGDLDILVTGTKRSAGTVVHANLYRNDTPQGANATSFTFTNVTATEMASGSITGALGGTCWMVDIDNDGDLDLLTSGAPSTSPIYTGSIKIYINSLATAPVKPAKISVVKAASYGSSNVLLSWAKTTDDKTPQNSLSYIVRVGTTAGGSDVVSPFKSKLPVFGDIKPLPSDTFGSYALHNLSMGTTYYWSVQAIDNTMRRSDWSDEGTFTVSGKPGPPKVLASDSISAFAFVARWDSVKGNNALKYYLDVARDKAFTNMVVTNKDMGLALTDTVRLLAHSTTYYYRLRAENSYGTSESGNVMSVTTTAPPAAPVALDADEITSSTLKTHWHPVSGAWGYAIDVATDEAFTSMIATNVDVAADTFYKATGLTFNTNYYFRVRAYNEAGQGANSNTVLTKTSAMPIPPATPVTTAATAIAQTEFTANWAAADKANGYVIDVATDNQFANLLVDSVTVGAGITYNVTGLTANTTYYYRVIAYNPDGYSAYSDTAMVTTLKNAPFAPTSVKATAVSQKWFVAGWDASTDADGYYLDVAHDSLFNRMVFKDTVSAILDTVKSLTPDSVYFCRVRAYNNGGPSANSDTLKLRTIALSGDATLSAVYINNILMSSLTLTDTIYDYVLNYGTLTAPVVSVVTSDTAATVVITQSASTTAKATIVVTSQNKLKKRTYYIYFSVRAPSFDATLSDIKVNGNSLENFVSSNIYYNYYLGADTSTIPVVTATPVDSNATVVVYQASSLTGTAIVMVTPECKEFTIPYYVYFHLGTGVNEAEASDVKLYSNGSMLFIESRIQITKVEVVSINGNMVVTANPNSSRAELSIAGLNSSIYLVRITTQSGIVTKKISVVK
jgi:hypothetical protein